ncbi:unnamed protein product [Didymodactylos carnosus]|uniref:Pentapeptide repeat-containing protein n=1 Tax=Didymodactylos carnosus TaxID=1234261 RepID=A0A8S2K4C7_9BILA|nr:unnamed protein product [Didymodactylos carnosus]CAF3837603.1 unnamed protein product [Didymodactylos carnosus]
MPTVAARQKEVAATPKNPSYVFHMAQEEQDNIRYQVLSDSGALMHFIKRNVACKMAYPANGKGGGKRNHSCFEWTKLGLSTLVPLMIGIFTVVSYIQQQHISEQQRHQDQEVANDIRLQERQIADALRAHSQEQAHALHYQDVYKTYLADVSNALFKENHEGKFLNNESKFSYIRSRTLSVLLELDSKRQTDLFLFLYETRLTTKNQLSLSGALFNQIHFNTSSVVPCIFNDLKLSSVYLSNSSFTGCKFYQATFTASRMTDIKFTGSSLTTNHKTECFRACDMAPYLPKPSCPSHIGIKTDFSDCVMERADFRQAFICLTSFHGATLDYATFLGASIESSSHNAFKGVLLAYANFSNVTFDADVMFINANLTNMIIKDDLLQDLNNRGMLRNVILPNGTTFFTQGNLFVNGDAQKDCPSGSSSISDWSTISGDIAVGGNSDNCYFFSTSGTESSMQQAFEVDDFSMLVTNNQALLNISAYFDEQCSRKDVTVMLFFSTTMGLATGPNSIISWVMLESGPNEKTLNSISGTGDLSFTKIIPNKTKFLIVEVKFWNDSRNVLVIILMCVLLLKNVNDVTSHRYSDGHSYKESSSGIFDMIIGLLFVLGPYFCVLDWEIFRRHLNERRYYVDIKSSIFYQECR